MVCRIAIIGDGAWATVCGVMLSENGNAVRIWSPFPQAAEDLRRTRQNGRYLPGVRLPDEIEVTGEDDCAMKDADIVLHAVPAQYARGVWRRLAGRYRPGTPICSVVKGVENRTLLRPTQVLADVLGTATGPLAALSGPSIAPEVAQKLPATVTVASDDQAFAETIQARISRPYFRVYTNSDLPGVELAGATKNVVAIAAGILDGLSAGSNAKAALLTRGLVEITRLGLAMGAKAETFAGLAGMGDLVTTCISPLGRNRSFGEAVGRGATVEQAVKSFAPAVVEGVATAASVVELADKMHIEMPITRAVYDVVFAGRSSKTAIVELMTRPLKAEGC